MMSSVQADHVLSWREGGQGNKIDLIPDGELERVAAELGPSSLEANSFAELRRDRARGKQVSAYRLGVYIVIGPEPTAKEKVVLMLANEATKHLKRSKAN